MQILLAILVIWLLLSVLGFVIKGLLWLGLIALILFVGTAAYGAIKGKFSGNQIGR